MVIFSSRVAWLAAALLLFVGVAAHAAISDCEELKQASIKEQLDRCVAHAACNFVLASKPDCAGGTRFLERTKGNALNQLTGLFNRNKALSANDVYEANLPEVDHPQDWKDRFAAIRDKVAQSGTEVLSGKLDDGTTWLYQGDVQDGKRQGWGVFFWAGGGMHRGEFAQDWRTGQGEYSAPNGYRAVGRFVNNHLDGEAWERLRDGGRKKGNFANGKLEGAGSLLFADGDLYTGNFAAGSFNGPGTYRWTSGSSFEGNFSNGKMDGQGTYTSTSGERSSRTYNAGTLVANAAPAAAPVSPTAACERSHTTCSAICVAGGLAALLSRSRYDTTACTDSCKSSQQQCLAARAPAPVAASAEAPVVASTVRTPSAPAPSSSGAWPAGLEPGNLYVVEYKFSSWPNSSFLLVAAKSKSEVETLVNNAATEYRRTLHPDALPHYQLAFTIVGECNGPNWGAVVYYIPGSAGGRHRSGWSCGAKTPKEAILVATRYCSTKTGTACDSMIAGSHETLLVSIGHSSARAWFPQAPTLAGYPPATMRWAALGATTTQFSGSDFVTSPQDAINQFGKACGPAGVHSCWITSKNWACLNASTTRKQGECVDIKLTAEGYLQ